MSPTIAKLREPVLGVHDRIPAHGRITIELYDEDTGRVWHRASADNQILDSYVAMQNQMVRDSYAEGMLDPGTAQDRWWMNLNVTPKEGPMDKGMMRQMRWLFLSDSAVAVDGDEWCIPTVAQGLNSKLIAVAPFNAGNISGSTYLSAYATFVGNYTGEPRHVQSVHDRTKRRYVADFASSAAIGTINSFGLGNCLRANTVFTGTAMPAMSLVTLDRYNMGRSASLGNSSPGLSATGFTQYGAASSGIVLGYEERIGFCEGLAPTGVSMLNVSGQWDSSNEKLWYVMGNGNIRRVDIASSLLNPFNNPYGLLGPAFGTIGASASQPIGLAIIGADMWLSYGTTLKRCAIPTDTTLSVTNTYAAVTGFTDAAILDITTDGTSLYLLGSTKVFVVNPATGAVTSSWAHNLGSPYVCTNINYVATPTPQILITAHYVVAAGVEAWNNVNTPTRAIRTWGYTTAGANGIYNLMHQNTDATGAYAAGTGITAPFAGGWGWLSFTPRLNGLIFKGPTHMSRAVLGSPVVKDGTKAMRVIYDLTFT